LIATINAMREKEQRERVFLAALQGVELEESEKLLDQSKNSDITTLTGYNAAMEGFGIGAGLGFMEVGS